jgi:hypothetical protein
MAGPWWIDVFYQKTTRQCGKIRPMVDRPVTVRVEDVWLRDGYEGYTFSCSHSRCNGKEANSNLPVGCSLVAQAESVSRLGKDWIKKTLVGASCTKQDYSAPKQAKVIGTDVA